MTKEPIVKTIDVLLILFTALLMNKLSGETIKYSLDCDWHKIMVYLFAFGIISCFFLINYTSNKIHNNLKQQGKEKYDERVKKEIIARITFLKRLYLCLLLFTVCCTTMMLLSFFDTKIF